LSLMASAEAKEENPATIVKMIKPANVRIGIPSLVRRCAGKSPSQRPYLDTNKPKTSKTVMFILPIAVQRHNENVRKVGIA
jgi:hypothetical protein